MIVYLVRSGDFAKIGLTADVRRRLAEIRAGRGVRIPAGCDSNAAVLLWSTRGDSSLERMLHDSFRDLSIGHEWFRWDDRLASWVAQRRGVWQRLPVVDDYWPNAVPDQRSNLPTLVCPCGKSCRGPAGLSSHQLRRCPETKRKVAP